MYSFNFLLAFVWFFFREDVYFHEIHCPAASSDMLRKYNSACSSHRFLKMNENVSSSRWHDGDNSELCRQRFVHAVACVVRGDAVVVLEAASPVAKWRHVSVPVDDVWFEGNCEGRVGLCDGGDHDFCFLLVCFDILKALTRIIKIIFIIIATKCTSWLIIRLSQNSQNM